MQDNDAQATVRIPAKTYARIKEDAQKEHVSAGHIIRRIIRAHYSDD